MNPAPLTRRQFVAHSSLLLGSTLAGALRPLYASALPTETSSSQPAYAVLEHAFGPRVSALDLTLKTSAGSHPHFEYMASDGRVHIHATSIVALCHGAYAYLREHCHVMITWSEPHADRHLRGQKKGSYRRRPLVSTNRATQAYCSALTCRNHHLANETF